MPLAEVGQPLGVPRVGDDLLDPGQRGADARELALGLPAGADQPERARPGLRQVPRGDRARGARAELAQPVGFDQRQQLGPVRGEERDDEAHALGEAPVGLDAGALELAIGGGHHVHAGLRSRPRR